MIRRRQHLDFECDEDPVPRLSSTSTTPPNLNLEPETSPLQLQLFTSDSAQLATLTILLCPYNPHNPIPPVAHHDPEPSLAGPGTVRLGTNAWVYHGGKRVCPIEERTTIRFLSVDSEVLVLVRAGFCAAGKRFGRCQASERLSVVLRYSESNKKR
jgi:hypothetical protein